VYVGHQGAGPQIWIFDEESGELIAQIAERVVERPHGLSLDADDGIWIADNWGNQVVRVDQDGAVTLRLGE